MLIGLIIVLLLCIILYKKGYRITKPIVTVNKDDIQKAERLQKEFDEVVSYNLAKALERKVV